MVTAAQGQLCWGARATLAWGSLPLTHGSAAAEPRVPATRAALPPRDGCFVPAELLTETSAWSISDGLSRRHI